MTRTQSILVALIAGAILASSAGAAGNFSIYYTKARTAFGPKRAASVNAGLRQQITQAERELARAYAASAKTDTSAGEVRAAQDKLNEARRQYAAFMATARKELADDPQIAPHRQVVRDLEARLAAASDIKSRSVVSLDLMHARGKLNAAETEAMAVDPDLAIAKAAVADAAVAVRLAQANGQTQRQQDPAVAAARQRLTELRRQFARR